MDSQQIGTKYIVRIDKGEEIVTSLEKFCELRNIRAGSIIGLGAAGKIEIGHFETETKEYHSKVFEGDLEIAPLTGNISTKDGAPYLHMHINFSNAELKAFSGHLNSAVVSGTFECIIEKYDGEIGRKFDSSIGLNLLEFK
jgi:hypothetical protein